MKILFLNTSDRTGGAAVAADRLRKALRKEGLDVSMLVRDKRTADASVASVDDTAWHRLLNRFRFYWERLVVFLNNRLSRENLFAVSIADTGTDVSAHPLAREADIIHLHWVNQGFLSLKGLKRLAEAGKPVVWTMHDMWPCTGICHHARECEKFRTGCESCFFLKSGGKDLSTAVFNEKKSLYGNADVTFVGCSRWIAGKAEESALSGGKRVLSIPNPIDTGVYRPSSQEEARRLLGLPEKGRLLLFGAFNIADKRKGMGYLVEALKMLGREDCGLAVFGRMKEEEETRSLFAMPLYPMGYLSEESKITALYNAVDLFVTPSLEDNLPNTVMEAMACGTPCVGFRIGGIPEMIDHRVNGYLARYKDAGDLADGIRWVLDYPDKRELSAACLKKVRENYAEEVVAKEYARLYRKLMDERQRR